MESKREYSIISGYETALQIKNLRLIEKQKLCEEVKNEEFIEKVVNSLYSPELTEKMAKIHSESLSSSHQNIKKARYQVPINNLLN